LAVREKQAGALKRPPVEVGGEGLVEQARRLILVGRQQRSGVTQAERDPARGSIAGSRLGGREPRAASLTRSLCSAASASSPMIHAQTTGW
jgi:hypothetical protein